MTKLMEWVTALVLLLSVWIAIYTKKWLPDLSRDHPILVLWFPVLAVAAFGIYSVGVIAYRVASFNDCEEAARDLQKEIAEAKADLKKKGLKME